LPEKQNYSVYLSAGTKTFFDNNPVWNTDNPLQQSNLHLDIMPPGQLTEHRPRPIVNVLGIMPAKKKYIHTAN
jgi:hypothetical protein